MLSECTLKSVSMITRKDSEKGEEVRKRNSLSEKDRKERKLEKS